jgi:rhodanese-related sulfurtransferase
MEEEHPEDADSSLSVGYTDVAHLDGGINAWKEQGKPVEDSSG